MITFAVYFTECALLLGGRIAILFILIICLDFFGVWLNLTIGNGDISKRNNPKSTKAITPLCVEIASS